VKLSRKQDLSIFYWLEGLVPSSVNVVDGFPSDSLELPTVSITSLDVSGLPFELGGCDQNQFFWRIDTFGKNSVQRDDLSHTVFDALELNIPVYDYDVGFPPGVSPPRIGTLIVSKRRITPIRVFKELVEKLYWRSGITFFTTYQVI